VRVTGRPDNNLTSIGWTGNAYRRKIPQLHDFHCVGVTGMVDRRRICQGTVRFLIWQPSVMKGLCDGGLLPCGTLPSTKVVTVVPVKFF
jgi:hypothetical protein